MERLAGRGALITGGASGIGAATARRLAEEGAQVAIADIQDDAGDRIAGEIRSAGGTAIFVHHDVADQGSWRATLLAVEEAFDGLDILVNNAGVGDLATIEDAALEDWARTIAIDQTSVFLGMQTCAPLLKTSGRGSVVNISSIFGNSGGFGNSPAYHAAKGAIRTLTKNVALHWAAEGIRVNSIHPGFIDTPLLDQARGTPFERTMLDLTPMARLGRPEEIAAGVAYLASDDASFVTGTELVIDGGYLAR